MVRNILAASLIVVGAAFFHSVRAQPNPGDPNGAAFSGEVAVALDTLGNPGRSIKANCTAGGNISLKYADGSNGIWIVQIGTNVIPGAIQTVNSSGTTATCTYGNLN